MRLKLHLEIGLSGYLAELWFNIVNECSSVLRFSLSGISVPSFRLFVVNSVVVDDSVNIASVTYPEHNH